MCLQEPRDEMKTKDETCTSRSETRDETKEEDVYNSDI